jgi:surfeit locus 1 family protein
VFRRLQPGTIVFAVVALAVSLGCVRLGIWQLSRLAERHARNEAVLSRLHEPPVAPGTLVADTAVARFRRVAFDARPDYEREIVHALRSRSGSPGIHILTPMRIGGGDTAVLVNRGWIYSPDGMTADLSRWREQDSLRVDGFLDPFAAGTGGVTLPVPRSVRRLDPDSLKSLLPYTLLPFVVIQTGDTTPPLPQDIPVRLTPPPLGDGSHRNYAIQWFAFALVGVVGAVVWVRRELRSGRRSESPNG